MDSDNSPAKKLNPLANLDVDNAAYKELKSKWQIFINRHPSLITDLNHIPKKLLKWSFCKQEWSDCHVQNMKADWKAVTELIIRRNIYLIQQWYIELNIEELRRETKINIEDIFDNRKWRVLSLNDVGFKEEFDLDENINRVSSPIQIGNARLNFYFTYPDSENDHLEENKIEFGLFEVEGNNYISKMKNKSNNEIDNDNFKWINGTFTLISGHHHSYTNLLREFADWLRKLPVGNRDKVLLTNHFKHMLSSKFMASF
jgi:hypothetical protein